MLVFSRKSLHYRIYTGFGLYKWRLDANPKNLCRYFWATVLGYLLPAIPLAFLIYLTIRHPLDVVIAVATVIGIFGIVGIAMSIVWLLTERIIPAIRNRPHGEPNLAWEFIKAKKRRFCPMISWHE